VHSIMSGRTVDNVRSLKVLTYDGIELEVGKTSAEELAQIIAGGGRKAEIYRRLDALQKKYADLIRKRFPNIPRRVSGYNLDELLPENGFNIARALVGTEGTCVTILEATLDLIKSPQKRALLVIGFEDLYSTCKAVPAILEGGVIGLEGFDEYLVQNMRLKNLYPDSIMLLPPGKAWLLAEIGADSEEEKIAKAEKLAAIVGPLKGVLAVKVALSPSDQARMWEVRESSLGATAFVPGRPSAWEGWEDSAVHPEQLADYLRDLRALMDRYQYSGPLYGHFGHGCVHLRINFDFHTEAGVKIYREFLDEAADLVVKYGGSLSGEHGDGQARAALLPKMFGEEIMEAFREFKSIWDPENKMNPGKVVNAFSPTENLRHGPDYIPWEPTTRFKFPLDGGSLANASLRCVGVGKCRRTDGGVMCPSYMVTGEEEHSTRGRARLLFEMMRGEVIKPNWKSEEVKASLDLCLACKGCKTECPVNVDMATYKAEFLSHYYEGRLRPRSAYAMGLIMEWSRFASLAPWAANAFVSIPGLSSLAKLAAGVHQKREFPRFAKKTFRHWFGKRPKGAARSGSGKKVILWADTLNNYFTPEVSRAAVQVLEAAGFSVSLPKKQYCCGRPLYDFGFVDKAKKHLLVAMAGLSEEITAGIPIIFLEPSCAAVFRDELLNLFPENEIAKKLSKQCLFLSEFLEQEAKDFVWPQLSGKAMVQGHCHHRAVLKFSAEEKLLAKLGLSVEVLDSGCCGMAGSFGFEEKHFDISQAVGERKLFPKVRGSSDETRIVANGFSCREQIEQATGRRTQHLAELLAESVSKKTT
jgi:Fe-S oxidoreductase/FAD/FMN-containing dehydrogenase